MGVHGNGLEITGGAFSSELIMEEDTVQKIEAYRMVFSGVPYLRLPAPQGPDNLPAFWFISPGNFPGFKLIANTMVTDALDVEFERRMGNEQ